MNRGSVNYIHFPACLAIKFKTRFFLQSAWFEALAPVMASFPGVRSLGYLQIDDGSAVYGYCPVLQKINFLKFYQFYSLSNYYTPVFDVIKMNEQDSGNGFVSLFRALKASSCRWHRFVIDAVPQEVVEDAVLLLTQDGYPVFSDTHSVNWYLPVTYLSYDDFFNARSSRLRHTVLRKSKSFYARPDCRVIFYFDEHHIETAISDYFEVYNDSWKQRETYPEFISHLIRLSASQKALRLAIAYVGDVPVAAQLWMVADDTAYIYKLAYKQAFKALGVGTVLTDALMRHVIDIDHVKTVDYLTGDDAYKRDWMTHRRERWSFTVYNTATVYGFILVRLYKIKKAIKYLMRS